MCSLRLSTDEKIAWERACDKYDHKHDIAVWESEDERRSVRYNTLTTQCGLFTWSCSIGKWILDREVQVTVHDPVAIRHLAERMLQ